MSAQAGRRLRGRDWRGAPTEIHMHGELITAVRALPSGSPVPERTILPGLHDHHVHLFAAGARARSVEVGGCRDLDDLTRTLRAAARTTSGPLRAVGYDDTVIGPLDRAVLDTILPRRALRVQHRGGHLWVLNSVACAALEISAAPTDGRFFDRDADLATASSPADPSSLARLFYRLASRGVVAVDDLTPTLTEDGIRHLRGAIGDTLTLRAFGAAEVGAEGVKVLLSDHALPGPEEAVALIHAARPAPVAVHAVTVEALAIMLSVREHLRPGDRLEHVFVTPPGLPEALLTPATPAIGIHPGFLRTHGDRHARHGDPHDVRDYLRVRSWLAAGATLLGGTDLPFSADDPWTAMQAAVDRRTASGQVLGADEALSPEESFTLFRHGGLDSRGARLELRVGDPADVCIIAGSWERARRDLGAVRVLATLHEGRFTHGGD